jgi:hypothetical protein
MPTSGGGVVAAAVDSSTFSTSGLPKAAMMQLMKMTPKVKKDLMMKLLQKIDAGTCEVKL